MKIFKDQPGLTPVDIKSFLLFTSNGNTLNQWFQSNPSLGDLKKAALVESLHRKRLAIIDRILIRIFKLERAEALKQLTK